MTIWKGLIDIAAEKCGGQNSLARRLGISSGNLSAAKIGIRPLAKEHIQELATILEEEPAQIWLAAQDARNPFRQGQNMAIFLGFAVILALGQNDANADEQDDLIVSQRADYLYIVE